MPVPEVATLTPSEQRTVRRTVRLPSDLDRRLSSYAARRSVSVPVLMRMLLSASMERELNISSEAANEGVRQSMAIEGG